MKILLTIQLAFLLFPFQAFSGEEKIVNSAIPYSPVSISNVMQVLTGLLAIILLIFILYTLFKKFGNYTGKMNGAIKIVAGMSIGPKEKIILLEAGGEQILIGVAPGVIRKLHKLETNIVDNQENEKVQENDIKENSFFEKFKKEVSKKCS